MAKILSYGMLTISMFLAIVIIYYLKRLETIKCNCSFNFNRNYISVYVKHTYIVDRYVHKRNSLLVR